MLNPAVLRSAARGADGITTLRVPATKGQSLMRKLEEGGKLPAVNLTVKHRAYPVHERYGLYWTYMGPAPVPVLSRPERPVPHAR